MTTRNIELKRLDSLARNRASAELKRRHPEEWEEIRQKIHHELKVELAVIGGVERTRNEIRHQAGDDGKCEECGAASPCQMEKKRIRERRYRQEQPVPTIEEI